jgi:hypothetical protein
MRLSWLEGLSWQNEMSTSRFADLMHLKEQTQCKHLFYTSRHFPKKKGLDCKRRGMAHRGLAIYIKKYLNAKEELWKPQIFHHAKIIIFKKSSKIKKPKSFKIL